jgi:hypothetical protein
MKLARLNHIISEGASGQRTIWRNKAWSLASLLNKVGAKPDEKNNRKLLDKNNNEIVGYNEFCVKRKGCGSIRPRRFASLNSIVPAIRVSKHHSVVYVGGAWTVTK